MNEYSLAKVELDFIQFRCKVRKNQPQIPQIMRTKKFIGKKSPLTAPAESNESVVEKKIKEHG